MAYIDCDHGKHSGQKLFILDFFISVQVGLHCALKESDCVAAISRGDRAPIRSPIVALVNSILVREVKSTDGK